MSQARDNYLRERTIFKQLKTAGRITTPPLTMPEQWDMLAYYLPESTLDRNGLNAHRRNHPQASSARVALRRAASLVDYRPRPEPGESFVLMAEAQPFDAETYAKLVIQLARHLAEQDHETDG